MNKIYYQGILKDRCGILNERRTRYYETYYDAHKAVEKLCRKSWGDRGTIDVILVIRERGKE